MLYRKFHFKMADLYCVYIYLAANNFITVALTHIIQL